MTAGSRGLRVSNNSTTRGRPPVMSLVLVVSRVLFVSRRQRDDKLREPGDFVDLFLDGDAGLEVLELNRASGFGEDRESVGVPFGQDFAELDRLVFFNLEPRTVHDVIALFLASLFVHDGDQAAAIHGNQMLAAAADNVQIDEAN